MSEREGECDELHSYLPLCICELLQYAYRGCVFVFFVFFGLNIKGREIHKDATVWQTGRQERAYEVVLAMLSMYMRTSL